MEEKLAIRALQISFHSESICNIKAELYDFNDALLGTEQLSPGERRQIPISIFLRNFYLRILN